MFNRAALFALLGLAAIAGTPLPASAQQPAAYHTDSLGADWREQQNEARQKVRDGRHVPLEQVIAKIRSRTPGKLLDAGIEPGADGRSVYRVRWAAADGRRIDFMADAQSGAILSGGG